MSEMNLAARVFNVQILTFKYLFIYNKCIILHCVPIEVNFMEINRITQRNMYSVKQMYYLRHYILY